MEVQTPKNEKEKLALRDQLITEHLPYVKRIVYRIAINLPVGVVDIADLINAGIIGLIQAAEKYDPLSGNKFMTYASFRIKGEILSELRARDFLSRSVRSKIRGMEKAYSGLKKRLDRDIEDHEVAKEMSMELCEFHKVKRMASLSFVSFDDIGYSSGHEADKLMGKIISGVKNDAFDQVRIKEVESITASAVKELPEKEKLVISLYYQDELTMKEIGAVLDITESRVSQLHSQAIIHLRKKLRKADLLED